jgi:hypothetical protein
MVVDGVATEVFHLKDIALQLPMEVRPQQPCRESDTHHVGVVRIEGLMDRQNRCTRRNENVVVTSPGGGPEAGLRVRMAISDATDGKIAMSLAPSRRHGVGRNAPYGHVVAPLSSAGWPIDREEYYNS